MLIVPLYERDRFFINPFAHAAAGTVPDAACTMGLVGPLAVGGGFFVAAISLGIIGTNAPTAKTVKKHTTLLVPV